MEIELRPGMLLGSYQLLVRIGRGGMANVWVARDRSRDGGKERLVALKAMLPEFANDSDFRAMFLEEGGIVRSIEHPHVVRVHAVGEDKGILYLAMEWVEGDSLRTILREANKLGPIPTEIAVRVIADTAAGLHAAHELRGWDGELRNIVHCDISPHNILVGADGLAKLVDFGVANATVHSDFGMADRVKGKIGYMSPEQARQEPLDRRSDIFALGIVLYELTTGGRLFQGESPAHTLMMVQAAAVMDLDKVQPGYPPKLAAIVKKALARDRDHRFQTALEFQNALEHYLRESPATVSRASVGSLVQRVLGSRIEGLRQQLRQALAAQAPAPAGSRPSMSAVPASAPVGARPSMSAVPAPAPAGSRPSMSAVPATSSPTVRPRLLSEPPSTSEVSTGAMSSTPRPETYDPSSRSRPEVFPWVFAAAGIAAAIGSIAYVTRPVEDEPPIVVQAQMSPVSPKRAAVQREVTPEQTAPEAAGVDIGSIPLDQADSRKLGRSAAQVAQEAARPPKANNDKPPVEKIVLAEATRPAKANNDKPSAEKIVLAEEPQVVLEETPENPDGTAQAARSQAAPAAPPPAAEALEKVPQGPFNRGQALSQLGASANRANGCRRPGGPSGAGRATITFGNDGAAKGVVVSAPFAGTPVGACVTSAFKSSRVPPFTGSPVTLPWSFRIAE